MAGGVRLLIDGYNLLYAAGLGRAVYAPGELERQRHKLLGALRDRLEIETLRHSTVVFDGRDPPAYASRFQSFAGMSVVFAAPDEEADDVIERLLASYGSNHKLIVVSSDHRLQKAAKRHRARIVTSETFWLESEGVQPPARTASPTRPHTGSPAVSATDWAKEFGLSESELIITDDLQQAVPGATPEPPATATAKPADTSAGGKETRSVSQRPTTQPITPLPKSASAQKSPAQSSITQQPRDKQHNPGKKTDGKTEHGQKDIDPQEWAATLRQLEQELAGDSTIPDAPTHRGRQPPRREPPKNS